MNESTIRKSAAAFTVRCTVCFAVLMCAIIPAPVFAQEQCSGIHMKILNIRNSTGNIVCALFQSPEGFPNDFLDFATNIMIIKIRESEASCYFADVPSGNYSMVVIHDENMNGKLDTNWLDVPKEGFGFSNKAKALLSAPSFSTSSFQYDGQNIDMMMNLSY